MEKINKDKNQEIFIYGASGHGRVVADIAKAVGYSQIDFIDDGDNDFLNFEEFLKLKKKAPIALGIGDNYTRYKIFKKLRDNDLEILTLIHPKAIVSDNVAIGKGTVVMPGAILNINVQVQEGVIINSGSIVEHDCYIEKFVHIAPGTALAGHVKVGKFSTLGIGSIIIQNKTIGAYCIVGAGAVVIDDVPKNKKVIGIPAKETRDNN